MWDYIVLNPDRYLFTFLINEEDERRRIRDKIGGKECQHARLGRATIWRKCDPSSLKDKTKERSSAI